MKRVLLTTPDYPPKVGGLSTFSTNIENVLNKQGYQVNRLVWNSISDLKKKTKEYILEGTNYEVVINVHFMGGAFFEGSIKKHLNFFHGSEILFYSPNPVKNIAKKLLKKKLVAYIEKSYANFFISNFTLNKLSEKSLKISHERDFVIHNGISIEDLPSPYVNDLNTKELTLVCVARDVPHKNLEGCITLCKYLSRVSGKKIKLYSTSQTKITSNEVELINISNISNQKREELYKECHFNLLLSLDHSDIGFYEGFGLTVLEAGQYGTPSIVLGSGGLPESVHHKKTGWVLSQNTSREVEKLWKVISNNDEYAKVSKKCFDHTIASHSLNIYTRIFKRFI